MHDTVVHISTYSTEQNPPCKAIIPTGEACLQDGHSLPTFVGKLFGLSIPKCAGCLNVKEGINNLFENVSITVGHSAWDTY